MRRTAPVVGLVAAVVLVTCTTSPPDNTSALVADRGARLYVRHCAVCHGQDGDADTVVASLLLPKPAAFRQGLFKLVSTTNGMPTEDDLVRTLRRGMPGSTMMSWSWMPEEDLVALAREVRHLAIRGRTESIHETAVVTHRPMSVEQAAANATRELTPGATVDVGTPATVDGGTLAEGERLFLQHCSACHGLDGRGLPATRDWPTDGTWLWPRDFTKGYLRGGTSHREIGFRIRAGMPGAHMPPTQMSTAETEALIAWVQHLVPETAGEHHAQWRRTIRVAKTARLPRSDDDGAFAKLEAIRLPLAPLWWRPDACSELWLRAAHDDQEVVLRLEWADATRNDAPRPDLAMGDGAAIQFVRALDPPLFAMGSSAEPVNIWRWHAFDPKEIAGRLDLALFHQGLDVPIGDTRPAARTESLQMHGVSSAPEVTTSGAALDVVTKWSDGRWTATFRRALAPRTPHEVDLAAPGPVLFAFAIWDGAIDQHAGSKAITTWHLLDLEH